MRRLFGCAATRTTGCAGLLTRRGGGLLTPEVSGAKRRARTAFLLIALAAMALPAGAAQTPVDLLIHPAELTFDNPRDGRKLLVTGILESGERIDLTGEAEVDTTSAPVERGDDGYFTPTTPGNGSLTIHAGGLAATVPVTVQAAGAANAAPPVTFVRDVLPAMNKIGCSTGTCHGAAKGKNGFKLSLRGYDPEFDYQSLLYDMSGRRFNRAEPARSLMLAKPTMQVAHEGGLRLDHGSRYYNQILDWISGGVPYGDPATDRVERLTVHPGEVFMYRPGMSQQTIVIAHYGDGSSRDVTREAHITSSNMETMAIEDTPSGPVATGLRRGESTLLVRYEGQFTTAPATVLSGREGFEWTALPQANYIDELIDEKLQRIEVLPSTPVDDAAFLRRASLDLTGRIPTPARVRAFLADDSPTQEKRNRLVDELIASDAYVDHWTLKWGDLLRSNRKFMSYKGMLTFRGWLREAIDENRPYDRLVRELVTASGSTLDQPAASYYRAARDPKEAMETTTQLFMGVRMVCAQCHDHPFERWTQNQYFEMTAFFAGLGVRPGFRTGEEIVFDKRRDNEQLHPKTNAVVPPKYLVPVDGAPDLGEGPGRRAALAELADVAREPVLRTGDREPRVELLHGPRDHRPGRRHPGLEPAGQRGPAQRIDRRPDRERLRPPPPDADDRHLPGLPVVLPDERLEPGRPDQLLPPRTAAAERRAARRRRRPRHGFPLRDRHPARGLRRHGPARSARDDGEHGDRRLPRPVRQAGPRNRLRVRAEDGDEPAAGAEPAERLRHRRRDRRPGRTGGEPGALRPGQRGTDRRALSRHPRPLPHGR